MDNGNLFCQSQSFGQHKKGNQKTGKGSYAHSMERSGLSTHLVWCDHRNGRFIWHTSNRSWSRNPVDSHSLTRHQRHSKSSALVKLLEGTH
eukprot:5596754-Amphidinium_carterae.1